MSDRDWLDQPHPCDNKQEVFFPTAGQAHLVALAKAICIQQCEFRAQCLEYALEDYGCRWAARGGHLGGTSDYERRKLRSYRHRSAS